MNKRKVVELLVKAKTNCQVQIAPHSSTCMLELDSDYYGPCTCGAAGGNQHFKSTVELIDEALDELLGD